MALEEENVDLDMQSLLGGLRQVEAFRTRWDGSRGSGEKERINEQSVEVCMLIPGHRGKGKGWPTMLSRLGGLGRKKTCTIPDRG